MEQVSSPNARRDFGSRVFDLTGSYPASHLLRAVARFLGSFCERDRPVERSLANFPETPHHTPNQCSGVRMDAHLCTGRRELLLPPVEGGVFVSDLIPGELENHDYRLVLSAVCTTLSAFFYFVIVARVGIVIASVFIRLFASRLVPLDHTS
ncbi:MAG: hypothetical protein ACR2NS_04810 [Gemmatimonadaceae bacterium]